MNTDGPVKTLETLEDGIKSFCREETSISLWTSGAECYTMNMYALNMKCSSQTHILNTR